MRGVLRLTSMIGSRHVALDETAARLTWRLHIVRQDMSPTDMDQRREVVQKITKGGRRRDKESRLDVLT